jgi:hypothetical protein
MSQIPELFGYRELGSATKDRGQFANVLLHHIGPHFGLHEFFAILPLFGIGYGIVSPDFAKLGR